MTFPVLLVLVGFVSAMTSAHKDILHDEGLTVELLPPDLQVSTTSSNRPPSRPSGVIPTRPPNRPPEILITSSTTLGPTRPPNRPSLLQSVATATPSVTVEETTSPEMQTESNVNIQIALFQSQPTYEVLTVDPPLDTSAIVKPHHHHHHHHHAPAKLPQRPPFKPLWSWDTFVNKYVGEK